MYRTVNSIQFSPSDLNHFVECEHLIALDLRATDGRGERRTEDPHAAIIRERGLEHERQWLDGLRAAGRQVVTIAGDGDRDRDWDEQARSTEEAMRRGVEVIYQGVFVDQPWRGVADFLIRVDSPTPHLPWRYEAWDTKLARHPKPYFILQLCWYSEQLARVQGVMPDRMHVVLGSGQNVAFRPADFLDYFRGIRGRFLRAVADLRPTYPLPVGHCQVCRYAESCEERRRADDHLSLVAGIRRDQIERLEQAGVTTVVRLAQASGASRAGFVPRTLDRLVRQASLQVEARTSGHRYELLQPEDRRGLGLLPAPSAGDVFFDIEGYPHFEASGGLEYMWGVTLLEDGAWTFRSFEAVDRPGERLAFEAFIDFVRARLEQHPDLHVYHYAPYETSAIKRLMGAHGTREAEVDDLLRRQVFVDLYQVVRQSLQISYDGYSLKKVRRFFMSDAGRGTVADGGESILEFQRFLEKGDPAILEGIRRYNAEDCESTRLLRDWLIERRLEAESAFGVAIPWFTPTSGTDGSSPDRDDTRQVRTALETLASVSPPEAEASVRLLRDLVDYHRREDKPGWWAFYDRLKKSMDELREDTDAIADTAVVEGLEPVRDKQSLVHTLSFPEQEFKLREGADVREPVEGKPAGRIVSIDMAGRLTLKRGPSFAGQPLPRALVARGPLPSDAQRASLVAIAERLLAGDDTDGAGRALLARAVPRLAGLPQGAVLQTMDLDRQRALVSGLDRACLFIQGPPGSGKTYTAARLIVHLIGEGRRVGITATSHKAIHNLLDEVLVAGRDAGITVRGVKKTSGQGETEYQGDGIENVADNAACATTDLPIVAGTAWLFARAEMRGRLDYLFVDEAGQVALADALAMSPCASSLVLLGDPQQLPHVTQGLHPPGAEVSVLEHLLAGAQTVAPDRGLFLEQSWRMHPDVCRFVSDLAYGGRLVAHPDCKRQMVESDGLSGTGLRYMPVEHTGNAQQSFEEARVIAEQVRRLLDGGAFTDRHGRRRALGPADILVVAPYNMQVHALLDVLPAGVEAGTVDRFQGREAPIVFFSLATSSGDDIPRGLEFLFSRHRLNVAVSRAMALAVLVCSPRLLETRCRTVEQMRLVNALCRFAASAGPAS